MRIIAFTALLPAAAPAFFAVMWLGLGFWRRHRGLWLAMVLATFAALSAAVYLARGVVLGLRFEPPYWLAATGWLIVAAATLFGTVADRQLGFRVRSFGPFFEPAGRIELITTGAYGVVRHPIYTAGIGYQLGVLFATGYLAVAAALAVFALGALWFTRQEERHLRDLLADPAAYDRYRARVPALVPLTKP